MALRGPLLAVDAIVAGYEPGLPVVRGASLAVAAGEIVALLGPNGAGKSTLVKALAGLVPVEAGQVLFEGREVTHRPAHLRVRDGMGFVPQSDNVFATMTVSDNLRIACDGPGDHPAAARRMADMFEAFPDLAEARLRLAGRLSGGQRQMLAIARALIGAPRLLMLDEPSAGLSPRAVDDVFARLAAIRADGIAILLVEQNVRAALRIADRAVVLVEGRDRHQGPAAELAGDGSLAGLFLGHRPLPTEAGA